MKATLLTHFLLTVSAFAQNDGLRVPTQQGDVIGSFATPQVRRFLGIPYARAKRWRNPVTPPKRSNDLNATTFGDSCPQFLNAENVEFDRVLWTFNTDNGIFVPESEDCLSVNIWSPSLNRKQRTAVLLWIYGGGFVQGTSNMPLYDGTSLVRDNDDITVVTFNYRLNIFGQPNAPQLDSQNQTQNFGLLDIEAAINWVHANIQKFGGDPDRITIFGQSAGSIAVEAYALAHPNDTKVKGLIQQSGNSAFLENFVGARPRIDADTWNAVAEIVGCGSNATAAQLSCMQQVPTKVLEDAVITNDVWFNVVPDGLTYFGQKTIERITAGKFLNVPLLLGTTKEEADSFTVPGQLLATGSVVPVVTEILSDLITAFIGTCTYQTSTSAHLQVNHKLFKYQYQGQQQSHIFAHRELMAPTAVFPNLSLQPGMRAYHGAELPIIFATYNNSPIAPTPSEIAFSKYMQSVWVGFARDPERGLLNLGWLQYEPLKPTYALLGGLTNQTGAVFVDDAPFDVICKNMTLIQDSIGAFQQLLQ